MSRNVVDAIIEVNNISNLKIGLIPSRRQVDYNGGYVNNWTTKSLAKYIKSGNKTIVIERDHGGSGQGFHDDDGKKSYEIDSNNFDIIHIDPWKRYQNYEDGLKETVNNIKLCYSINPYCYYEVGTEESIRHFSSEELERMIEDLKTFLPTEIFTKIKYVVVQSGVGLNLSEQINIGSFKPDRLEKMVNICKRNKFLTKEHNGDYLSLDEIKVRFDLGLDAINIAPEFGQLETDVYLKIMKQTHPSYYDEFYNICYRSKRWSKWIKPDLDPKKEKNKIIKISGHYVLSNPEFTKLKNKLAKNMNIEISEIDQDIKEKIKAHLLNYKKIIVNQ